MALTTKELLQAARMAEDRQEFAKAEHYYRAAMTADPGNAEPYAALGFLALQVGRYPLFRELSRRANKINPNLVLQYVQTAQCAKAERRASDAAVGWQRALALQPNNPKILI